MKYKRSQAYIFFYLERFLHSPHTFISKRLQPERDRHLEPLLVVGDRNTKQFSITRKTTELHIK